ncbi:hypothetical protein [Kamptonema formosum]|uniref:hypothetical protein n=1 Tax=Kamptonema formosum TaxID=331992 RepID=UPI0012DCE9D3|nr:hypothetical protein [Oscillatoria sp. PCC 10802]
MASELVPKPARLSRRKTRNAGVKDRWRQSGVRERQNAGTSIRYYFQIGARPILLMMLAQ